MKTQKVIGWALVVSLLWAAEGTRLRSEVPTTETPSANTRFKDAAEAFYWAYLDAQPHLGIRLGYH